MDAEGRGEGQGVVSGYFSFWLEEGNREHDGETWNAGNQAGLGGHRKGMRASLLDKGPTVLEVYGRNTNKCVCACVCVFVKIFLMWLWDNTLERTREQIYCSTLLLGNKQIKKSLTLKISLYKSHTDYWLTLRD